MDAPDRFRKTDSGTPRAAPVVNRFRSIAGVEFLINAALMFVDRRVADAKLAGNLLVKQPLGQKIHYFILALRQPRPFTISS